MELKKVTAAQIIEANTADDEERPEQYYIQYKGIPVTIKGGLTLHDILKIADNVVDFCFLDDGEYIPELKEFFLRRELLETATNVELPEDIEECYELIMNSDLGKWVDDIFGDYLEVYAAQMPQLRAAIQDKIDYMADSGLALLRSRMDALIYAIESFSDQNENLFNGTTPEDMQKFISSVASIEKIDEEKLVKAVAGQQKKTKSKAKKKDKSEPKLEVVK